MKLALISLYSTKNIGIRLIDSIIQQHGFHTDLIFFKDKMQNEAKFPTLREYAILIELLKTLDPDIIGISIGSSIFSRIACKITKLIKQDFDKIVLWGGIHPTIAPEECIEHADIICIGEGEYPILELISSLNQNKDISKIDNIWLKRKKTIIKNTIRPLIQNLDEIPYPVLNSSNGRYFIEKNRLLKEDPLRRSWQYYTIATRGCPFSCTFCVNSFYKEFYKHKGSLIRYRSVNNVIQELIMAKNNIRNLKQIVFFDDVFPSNIQWIKDFAEKYKQHINLPFWCFFHPSVIKYKILLKLKEAGLEFVNIGIQSGSPKIRKDIFHRQESNEEIIYSVETIQKVGLIPYIDVLVDNPFESLDNKKENLNFFIKLPRPFRLNLYSLIFFPKTKITQLAISSNLLEENEIYDKMEKAFRQASVTFDYKRAKIELGTICLIVLTGKSFIPKSFIRYWSQFVLRPYPHFVWFLLTFTLISTWMYRIYLTFKLLAQGKLYFLDKQYLFSYLKTIK